jgi:hypothetical protein
MIDNPQDYEWAYTVSETDGDARSVIEGVGVADLLRQFGWDRTTTIQPPRDGEDLFLYVTDGAGQSSYNGRNVALGQYDVILGRPEIENATITASEDDSLHFMSFYLPSFMG